jgi:hypothetical protein
MSDGQARFIDLDIGQEVIIDKARIKNLGRGSTIGRIKIGVDVDPGVKVLRGELLPMSLIEDRHEPGQ